MTPQEEVITEKIVENPVHQTVTRPEFSQVQVDLPEIQTRVVSHDVKVYREEPIEEVRNPR